MSFVIAGNKVGMTRVFSDDNRSIPVTVVELFDNVVTQLRTPENDGYSAVQVGYDEVKPRNSTMPMIAHDHKAGTTPKRHHGEFRVDDTSSFEIGQVLGAEQFDGIAYVDVTGVSKGKGFQGGMKRHGFKGQLASHGVERKHRSPGSIGGHANNPGKAGRIKKGKKMNGQMGDERGTVRNLDVVRVEADRNLLLVKGAVPGANGGIVRIRPSVRLRPTKAAAQEAAAG